MSLEDNERCEDCLIAVDSETHDGEWLRMVACPIPYCDAVMGEDYGRFSSHLAAEHGPEDLGLSSGGRRVATDGGVDQSSSGAGPREPNHGEEDESGTRFWCVQCKTYVPEFNWDSHERYHNPDREIPDGSTNIGGSQDGEPDRWGCPGCGVEGDPKATLDGMGACKDDSCRVSLFEPRSPQPEADQNQGEQS